MSRFDANPNNTASASSADTNTEAQPIFDSFKQHDERFLQNAKSVCEKADTSLDIAEIDRRIFALEQGEKNLMEHHESAMRRICVLPWTQDNSDLWQELLDWDRISRDKSREARWKLNRCKALLEKKLERQETEVETNDVQPSGHVGSEKSQGCEVTLSAQAARTSQG